MDYKKTKTDTTAITRDTNAFNKQTGNLYETLVVLSKRANQIQRDLKTELSQKIDEFVLTTDNLEEIFENREQIEIAKFYEGLPKPSLYSIYEYHNDMIYYRNPRKEKTEEEE